jgi:hypothetical protein
MDKSDLFVCCIGVFVVIVAAVSFSFGALVGFVIWG